MLIAALLLPYFCEQATAALSVCRSLTHSLCGPSLTHCGSPRGSVMTRAVKFMSCARDEGGSLSLSLSLSLLRASSGESFFPPSVVLGEWRWRGGQADSTSSVPNAHLDIVIYGDLCCLHLRLVPSRPLRAQHSFFAIRRQTNSSFGGIQHKTIFCISTVTNFRPSCLLPPLFLRDSWRLCRDTETNDGRRGNEIIAPQLSPSLFVNWFIVWPVTWIDERALLVL